MTDREEIQIQAQWVLDPSIQPAAANQMILQDGMPEADGIATDIYLTFGHVNPPVFNSPEAAIGAVLPVVPVARLLLSRDRLKAFHAAMGAHLDAGEASNK